MSDTTTPSGASFLVHATDPSDVVTPEDLGEEERMLSRAMHEFAEREVAPVMEEVEVGDPEVNRRLFEKAAELGLFMAEVPEEYGGLDLDVLAVTSMSAHGADIGPLGSLIYGHQGIGTLPIVYFGTPEQVERYLVPCMEGEMISAFALTEPGTGSDAMNIKTRAVLNEDGTHYVLNGAKQWITNAGWADLFILFAKVDGEHFSAFLVERDTDGLSVGEPEDLLGLHGSSVCAVSLEDVEVPAQNLLGEVGKGHLVAFCTLNMGRLKLAGSSGAQARKAVGIATRYAAERVQFGRPIAEFGLIQRKLADMAARAFAAESMVYRTAGLVYQVLEDVEGDAAGPQAKLDALSEFSVECAMSKVYAAEAHNGNADDAVQVFGGYGFSEEYKPAKMYRDSRISRIYEGTNEICRLYAQRAVFKKAAREQLSLQDAVRQEPSGLGDTFGDLYGGISDLKQVYLRLAHRVVQKVGMEELAEPVSQQYLASLADVAIEIYAAETAWLRVAKLQASGAADGGIQDELARLVLQRAVERIRAEAETVLAQMMEGDTLRAALVDIDHWLPFQPRLVAVRDRVARKLVEEEGEF